MERPKKKTWGVIYSRLAWLRIEKEMYWHKLLHDECAKKIERVFFKELINEDKNWKPRGDRVLVVDQEVAVS